MILSRIIPSLLTPLSPQYVLTYEFTHSPEYNKGVAGTEKVGGGGGGGGGQTPKKIQAPIFLVLCINDGFSENNILIHTLSQRGDSPFVYRDGIGWPASLPYIRKIRVSVAIGTQSGIRLHKRVPMVKIWGSSKNYQNWITGKLLKL